MLGFSVDSYTRKKSVYLFLLFIMGYVISSNYTYFPYLQDGKDTYFYMLTAKMILNAHYIPWILHPTSYFGLYPFSVPPGSQTILASLFCLSGTDSDISIIVMGDIMFIFASLIVLLISHKITKNILLSMFFSFVAINMPSFFNWLWNAFTSRILFYLLFLFWLLFLLVIGGKLKHNFKTYFFFTGLSALFGVFLYSIHRSAFLLVIFSIVFLFNISFKKFIGKKGHDSLFKYLLFALLIFSLLFPFYNNLQIDGYNGGYYNNGFIRGTTPSIQLFNFLLSVGAGSGFLLIFIASLLLLKFLKYHGKLNMFDVFSFSFLISLFLLSPAGLYVRCIIGIAFLIISIDISSKFKFDFKIKISIDKRYLLGTLIIFLILNNIYMQSYWTENKIENYSNIGSIMPENAYAPVLYLNLIMTNKQSIVVDSWYLNRWVQAHSSVASLPPPLGMNSEINYVVYFTKNISAYRISFWEFLTDSKKSMGHHYIYYSDDFLKPPMDYIKLMNNPPHSNLSTKILDKYHTKYALKDLYHKNKYLYWGNRWVSSKFYKNLDTNDYKIYVNDRISIYCL